MPQRYFTLEEAESLLPRLEGILGKVQDLKRQIDTKVNRWHGQPNDRPADSALAQGQVDFLITEINSHLQKVYELGCLPKDLDSGLIDFPARFEGKEGYFCWKLGERCIGFWHGLTEGYQGRKPIPHPTPHS